MIHMRAYNTRLRDPQPKNKEYSNHQNVFSETVLQLVRNTKK